MKSECFLLFQFVCAGTDVLPLRVRCQYDECVNILLAACYCIDQIACVDSQSYAPHEEDVETEAGGGRSSDGGIDVGNMAVVIVHLRVECKRGSSDNTRSNNTYLDI